MSCQPGPALAGPRDVVGEDEESVTLAGSASFEVLRVQATGRSLQADDVIEEVPVALSYNGISHAVMLATPTDLEDFALGFSVCEGVVAGVNEIHDLDIQPGCDGIVIDMQIAQPRFLALKERRRSLAGRTGCGLCGIESLEQLGKSGAASRKLSRVALQVRHVDEALRQLTHWQPLRQQTGASHVAAWVDLVGKICFAREDAGRHNALDKLAGALLQRGEKTDEGFILVSSRASYEMVQKAAALGAGALVAVSAPTALAVRTAAAAGMLLVGFARPGQLVAYSHAERLSGEMPASAAQSRGLM